MGERGQMCKMSVKGKSRKQKEREKERFCKFSLKNARKTVGVWVVYYVGPRIVIIISLILASLVIAARIAK